MAGSAYRFFGTAEEYVHTIRAAEVQGAITKPGLFHGELTRIDFDRLWMQRGAESLPRTMHVAIPAARSPVFMLTDANQAATRLNGMEFKPGELLFWGSGSEQYHRTEAETRWGAMSLTPDQLTRTAVAILGCEIVTPKETLLLRPGQTAMRRLMGLHRVAGAIAKSAPEIIAHTGVAEALEQALVHAMLLSLSTGTEDARTITPMNKRSILAGLEAFIAVNPGKPLYLVDLCTALGAPERTLRRAFQEHLGISPNRYLWLRRMHLARRALQFARPSAATVTSIAMDYGFLELGRFAVAYRQLFGETPAATLRRPPDFVPRPRPSSYLGLMEGDHLAPSGPH